MGRLIVLILLVVLAVWLIRRALRASSRAEPARKESPAQQDLIRCARCGVHLPRAEARLAGGLLYCGEEHARLGAGEG
ncbi:MAG TPA: PP0621 family protein [Burkholderiales bacterium]|jgi:uncharacterized protein